MSKKQIVALAACTVLTFGVFAPVISVPVIGSINLFYNGHGDGVLLLVGAGISAVCALIDQNWVLWLTGLGSFGITLFDLFNAASAISNAKGEMDQLLSGDLLKGFADVALQSVQLEWGWAVVIFGSSLLLASAAMSDPETIYETETETSFSGLAIIVGGIGTVALVGTLFVILNLGREKSNTDSAKRVRAALQANKAFKKLNIQVTEVNGEITLQGIVKTPKESTAVFDLAKNVVGDQTVNNQLTVEAAEPEESAAVDNEVQHSGNREQRLIQEFCGEAGDINACMEKELPGFGSVTLAEEPTAYSNELAFRQAKNKCDPHFRNDRSMYSYCLYEVYSGIMEVTHRNGPESATQ
jgi:BON domain